MSSPSVDIIVPVWNSPFETRACLAAILSYSPEVRLIVIDNGSSRETELMLEEFSEPLGERGLFISTPRNVGPVPSINIGLASSEADFAVIVRPNVMVGNGWLGPLLKAASDSSVGMVTPLFRGCGAPQISRPVKGCSSMETFSISFAALLLRGKMHRWVGGFDEGLDSGEWCLRDYIRRCEASGYRTLVSSDPELLCEEEIVFGSLERRRQQSLASMESYCGRWGAARHYCVYFGREAETSALAGAVDCVVAAARLGHRFTLFLHRRQQKEFLRQGWNGLHTGVELRRLSLLAPGRDLARQYAGLRRENPDVLAVRGFEGIGFSGADAALPFSEVAALSGSDRSDQSQLSEVL